MVKLKDMTDLVFGRLTVIERVPNESNRQARWLCECACGNTTVVQGGNLRGEHTTSCGCYNAEQVVSRFTKHDMAGTPEYQAWTKMKLRCYSKQNPKYPTYGARGIAVCDRWLESFDNFFADMGIRPDNTSIDRINNEGDYTPENCRWATPTEQARNTRRNVNLSFNGKTQCISAWAEELGIKKGTIQARLYRGWSTERALT
ncbi:MAG: hypothetical protein DRI65_16635 [Chloroflexota bacterium]|nr:MAG: hypothetical protein DRI65_16635 [Chloroflexota bacterium]